MLNRESLRGFKGVIYAQKKCLDASGFPYHGYLIAPKDVDGFVNFLSHRQTNARVFGEVMIKQYMGNKFPGFYWVLESEAIK